MSTTPHFKIGPYIFTPGLNEISKAGKKERLEDRASRVLEYLCRNAGEVVSKEELIEGVWQGRHLSEQSVPVVISNLRKVLAPDGEGPALIETIPKRGYRVVDAKATTLHPGRPVQRWFGVVAALVAVAILGIFFLQSPETEARKPGVILTLNDIQNATGDEAQMSNAIALSEAGSHFLSKADGILLIRHWWNVEADDPTGGIFARYGDDAPIYHVSGTLIKEGNGVSVTLFLNDPKTDEVLWSEAYSMVGEDYLGLHIQALGKILAFLGLQEKIMPPGDQTLSREAGSYYWLGLYFWNLGTEGAAKIAADMWHKALQVAPDMDAAKTGLAALSVQWPGVENSPPVFPDLTTVNNNPSVLVQAGTIALYGENDPGKAAGLARRALRESPNDFTAYALLAESLVREGRVKEALLAINEARLLAPFSSVYGSREEEISALLEAGD